MMKYISDEPCSLIKNSLSRVSVARKKDGIKVLRTSFFLFLFMFVAIFSVKGINEDRKTLMQHTVPDYMADDLGNLMVKGSCGQIQTLDSYARSLLNRLYGRESFKGLSATQVLIGFMIHPYYWLDVHFIKVPGKELRSFLEAKEKYYSYAEFFDEMGQYHLLFPLQTLAEKERKDMSPLQKSIMVASDKVEILKLVMGAKCFPIYPTDSPNSSWASPGDDLTIFSGPDSVFAATSMIQFVNSARSALENNKWENTVEVLGNIVAFQKEKTSKDRISTFKLRCERFYYKSHIALLVSVGYLAVGLFLLFLFIFRDKASGHLNSRFFMISFRIIVGIFVLFQFAGILIRWYSGAYSLFPNGYDLLFIVSVVLAVSGLLLSGKSTVYFAVSSLLSGVIVLLAGVLFPEYTPLIPCLVFP
ncbi:hypothetical protein [Coprobacter tertius]|uniref:Uncharacterized protein n=1 Tax=Coprobacter tertius TaxID=2944915 RepID=A0ABT1MIR8_9BACT|nr:hypothetical protein [Coprobacter tertius]MCP9612510.1 hypothetical protein [Coprobacter tertius]